MKRESGDLLQKCQNFTVRFCAISRWRRPSAKTVGIRQKLLWTNPYRCRMINKEAFQYPTRLGRAADELCGSFFVWRSGGKCGVSPRECAPISFCRHKRNGGAFSAGHAPAPDKKQPPFSGGRIAFLFAFTVCAVRRPACRQCCGSDRRACPPRRT